VDIAEFEHWYRREHDRVVNSLYLISGSVDAARDATDEAFARAAARWSRVRRMTSPAGWTFRVALNVLRREMRGRTREADALRRRATDEVFVAQSPDPDLWHAVAALPDRQRATIVLRYIADLPEAEIAEALGVTRGTVASNLAHARESLAAALGDALGTEVRNDRS
jgi:RNA polymerase sigma-70 factor (ECF subfamily)